MNEISIVIPTLNRPEFLSRLLKSISAQTYQKFEVLIIDDASDDQASNQKVIESYKDVMDLKYFVNEKRSGAPVSRNRGITEAKFDLIALVDDDDEWLPSKLEKQIEIFAHSPEEVGLVYTWTRVVDSNGNAIGENLSSIEGLPKREILEECFISSPSVMVKKKAIIASGLFDISFRSCQDWDMWTRLVFANYQVRVVKEILTLYYKHTGPSIGSSPKAKQGYLQYYSKHVWKLFRYFQCRHLWRLIKLKVIL